MVGPPAPHEEFVLRDSYIAYNVNVYNIIFENFGALSDGFNISSPLSFLLPVPCFCFRTCGPLTLVWFLLLASWFPFGALRGP